VHFVRFLLTPEQRRAIASGDAPVEVVVDHPSYQARAGLSPDTRAALAEDLGERVSAG
jgi:hypothetical protein